MASAIKKRRRQSGGSSKSHQVRALLAKGMSAGDIAKEVGCTTGLVYVIKSTMKKKGKRGPGRPAKASLPSMDGIDGFLDAVKSAERERAQLRATLEKIQTLLATALA
jgi:transposase